MSDIQLPDFDEIYALNDKIFELSKKKGLLEIKIKLGEADVTTRATFDKKYYVNDKPPSQTYIDNSWKFTGFDGELTELRNQLVQASTELEYVKSKLDLLKLVIEVWRTKSANERRVFE